MQLYALILNTECPLKILTLNIPKSSALIQTGQYLHDHPDPTEVSAKPAPVHLTVIYK